MFQMNNEQNEQAVTVVASENKITIRYIPSPMAGSDDSLSPQSETVVLGDAGLKDVAAVMQAVKTLSEKLSAENVDRNAWCYDVFAWQSAVVAAYRDCLTQNAIQLCADDYRKMAKAIVCFDRQKNFLETAPSAVQRDLEEESIDVQDDDALYIDSQTKIQLTYNTQTNNAENNLLYLLNRGNNNQAIAPSQTSQSDVECSLSSSSAQNGAVWFVFDLVLSHDEKDAAYSRHSVSFLGNQSLTQLSARLPHDFPTTPDNSRVILSAFTHACAVMDESQNPYKKAFLEKVFTKHGLTTEKAEKPYLDAFNRLSATLYADLPAPADEHQFFEDELEQKTGHSHEGLLNKNQTSALSGSRFFQSPRRQQPPPIPPVIASSAPLGDDDGQPYYFDVVPLPRAEVVAPEKKEENKPKSCCLVM